MLLLLIMVAQTACKPVHARDNGLQPVIVVTFSHLKPDVELLLCNGVVYALVPPSIDPHDYQLKPSDIEVLRRADVIVSTGHTHFELEIRNLVKQGELSAKLVDLSSTPEVKLLVNPVTKQPNYHLPVRDPVNYLVFMSALARVLAEADPNNEKCYYGRFHGLAERLAREILVYRNQFNGSVVADGPHVQYCAEWLGLRVAWIVKPEEGVQVTPENVEKAKELIKSGGVVAVFVTKPKVLPESRLLVELAEEYGVPVVEVYSPTSSVGVYDSLLDVVMQVKELNLTTTVTLKPVAGDKGSWLAYLYYIVPVVASFTVGFIAGILVNRARRW